MDQETIGMNTFIESFQLILIDEGIGVVNLAENRVKLTGGFLFVIRISTARKNYS